MYSVSSLSISCRVHFVHWNFYFIRSWSMSLHECFVDWIFCLISSWLMSHHEHFIDQIFDFTSSWSMLHCRHFIDQIKLFWYLINVTLWELCWLVSTVPSQCHIVNSSLIGSYYFRTKSTLKNMYLYKAHISHWGKNLSHIQMWHVRTLNQKTNSKRT